MKSMEDEDKLRVIIGDHIRWQFDVEYAKCMIEYWTLMHDLAKALLMGDDKMASAEVNRICDVFPNEKMREEIRAEYLKKASMLKPVDWPNYLPKLNG